MNIAELQKKAFLEITEILQHEPESISCMEKTDKGWMIQCEVLEKKAVPEIFDLLKVFEFTLDNNGKTMGFKQVKKVRRGDMGD